MDIRSLAKILDGAPGLRVLCVGDVVLDRFVYGATHRVSREAPVPVLDETSVEHMLGGAGNVIRNLRALGAEATLISAVGNDVEGEEVAKRLNTEGAGNKLIVVDGRPTPVKSRFVANGHQMLCVDRNPQSNIDAQTEVAIISSLAPAIAEADIIVLSDYGRGLKVHWSI